MPLISSAARSSEKDHACICDSMPIVIQGSRFRGTESSRKRRICEARVACLALTGSMNTTNIKIPTLVGVNNTAA